MTCFSYDCIYICVPFGVRFYFFPRVFFHSRVTAACPVATDLTMRVDVRTSTNNDDFECLIGASRQPEISHVQFSGERIHGGIAKHPWII